MQIINKTLSLAVIAIASSSIVFADVSHDVSFTITPSDSAQDNYARIQMTAKQACKIEYSGGILPPGKFATFSKCISDLVEAAVERFDHEPLTEYHRSLKRRR